MRILGIESSCDETAAAVVDGVSQRVLSSVVASQVELHVEYGGVVPEIASRAHVERILPVIRSSLTDAGLSLIDIDAVAVGHRPGLVGSLLVGVSAAKALAWSLGKPLIGVDHVHAHLAAGLLDLDVGGAGQDLFPAIGLVISGGHTSLYRMESLTQLQRLGATIDDAIGEAYDKAATILGLPYPGGPKLDELAESDGADDRAVDLPISRLGRESLDFSFSGLKTALLYEVRGVPRPRNQGGGYPDDAPPMTDERRRDLAASFQRACARAVLLKLERALAAIPGCRGLLVGGGVSANTRLRRELAQLADAHGLTLRLPAMPYCIDNAAMIAGLGARLLAEGRVDDLSLTPVPTTAC